jgi:hypothetical protein
MVWAWNEGFCDFWKGAIAGVICDQNRYFAICDSATCNHRLCDSAIYAISKLDGERSTDHSNQKYGVTNMVCMILHFCFTIFFYHMLFFEYLQSHLIIANRCSI